MPWRSRMAVAYGVGFSGDRVSVVRGRRRSGGVSYEVVAHDMDPLADPRWKAIAAGLSSEQEKGVACVTVPALAQDVFIRPLEAPLSSPRKARAVLPSLLDVQLPFPLEQCVYAFAPMASPGAEGKAKMLSVAMPKDRLQRTLEAYQAVGLDPEYVDPEALALWGNRLAVPSSSPGRAHVVLYMGDDRTVAVAGRESLPLSSFSARMTWRDSAVQEKLCARLRPFLAGALREIGGDEPDYFVAGAAASLSDSLRERLGVDSSRWRIMDNADTALLRSLVDRVLLSGAADLHLRAGEWAHPLVERRAAVDRVRSLATVAVSALLLIAASVGSSVMVKRQHDRLQRHLQEEARALTGWPTVPRGQELFVARQAMQAWKEQYEAVLSWREPSAYALFVPRLHTAHARGIALEALSVRPDAVLARGSVADWNETDALARPLSQAGWKVEVERRDAGLDERVHFTLRAQP